MNWQFQPLFDISKIILWKNLNSKDNIKFYLSKLVPSTKSEVLKETKLWKEVLCFSTIFVIFLILLKANGEFQILGKKKKKTPPLINECSFLLHHCKFPLCPFLHFRACPHIDSLNIRYFHSNSSPFTSSEDFYLLNSL